MTFATSVAGPSRLPFKASTRCARALARRCASTEAGQAAVAESEGSFPNTSAVEDKESKAARKKEKELWATHDGYLRWLRTEAGKFRNVNKGERAAWLGGSVPYGTNPSFRPPPPLGNDTQEHLYSQLSRKNRTAGSISEQYNVSKARLEAVRKLKEVEREMIRQGIPLQQAFQDGMEPLLGISTLRDAKSKTISDRAANDEASYRGGAMGTRVEKEEEERYEAGIGQGGAFSIKAAESRSVGRTVWEFRSEEMIMEERAAEAAARNAVSKEGLAAELLAEAEAAPATPEQARDARASPIAGSASAAVTPSHELSTGRTVFRFIDTSSKSRQQGMKQRKA